MGFNHLIKCLFVFLTLQVKFNPLHLHEARVIGGLCNGCGKELVWWNPSFPVWGSGLLRAAPVPQPAALVCAFAMLGWEWQMQSLHAVYKAWSWLWCPVSAIYNSCCPSLTEYLSKEKGPPYCTRELKNHEKGQLPDCTTVRDTGVVMAGTSMISTCQLQDQKPFTHTHTRKGKETSEQKGPVIFLMWIPSLYVWKTQSLYFSICMSKLALVLYKHLWQRKKRE